MVAQLNAVARLWWDWSAAMFWQAGLLILLIGCLDLIIRKWAWPQLRYALWSLILIKLILPPTLSLPSGIVPELRPMAGQALRWLNSSAPAANEKPVALSDCGLPTADSIFSSSPQFSRVETAGGGVQPPLAEGGATIPDTLPAVNPQSAIHNPQLEWPFYAMTIWLAGTLILGVWLFLRLHSIAGRHAHRAAGVPKREAMRLGAPIASLPQSFYSQLADCAKRLGLRRVPGVVVTRRLTSPAVFGVFRPVLLVPKGYLSRLSRRDTEHLLLHELAHVKRGDLVLHGLYLVLQIVYWYNPLLWLVRRQVHHLRELSCDATVAALLRERTAAYRQTLLETARRLLTTSVEPGLGLLGLFEDSNHLLVRLHWLTKPTWRYRTMKRVTVATTAALMLACVLPMAQAQPEAASNEVTPVSNDEVLPVRTEENDRQAKDRLSEEIAALQAQLEQLTAQQQELRQQLEALHEQRGQMGPANAQPGSEAPPGRARGSEEVYTVKDGDTLAGIARKFYGQENLSESIARILKHNRLENSDRLPVGQELRIPLGPEPQARQSGEWVFRDGRGTNVPSTSRDERLLRAQEEARRAAVEAEEAPARISRDELQAQEEQMRQWEQSEQMQQWRRDVEHWRKQVEEWARAPAQRSDGIMSGTHRDEPGAPASPMPPMPPLPALLGEVPAGGLGHPGTPSHGDEVPHVGGSVAHAAPTPHVRVAPTPPARVPSVPHAALPHVSVPPARNAPALPAPPAIPAPPAVPSPAQEGPGHVVPCGEYLVESFPAGTRLEMQNEVGAVTVEGTEDGTCTVKATARIKGVEQEEARQIAQGIKIHVTPTEGRLRVHAEMPEGLSEEQRNRIEMDFHIIVPQEAEARIAQKVGPVRLSSLLGKVQAVVNVGSIQASDLQGDVLLRTEVGNIDFVTSRDLSAKVQAQANVGSITSNLPLRITSAAAVQGGGMQSALGSNATGVLGDGQNKIDLSANVGSIGIRSQPAAPKPVF